MLALLLVPLLLATLLAWMRGGDIEADLRARSLDALKAGGLDGLDVTFDGRDATLAAAGGAAGAAGLSAADLDRAESLVDGVDGVRVVDTPEVSGDGGTAPTDEPSTEPTTEPTDEPADCDAKATQKQIDDVLGKDKVHFEYASSKPQGASLAEVESIAAILLDCANLAVTITGHLPENVAESSPIDEHRADNVKAALVAAGVPAEAVTATGGGHDDLLGEATPEGHDLNRFADVTVE